VSKILEAFLTTPNLCQVVNCGTVLEKMEGCNLWSIPNYMDWSECSHKANGLYLSCFFFLISYRDDCLKFVCGKFLIGRVTQLFVVSSFYYETFWTLFCDWWLINHNFFLQKLEYPLNTSFNFIQSLSIKKSFNIVVLFLVSSLMNF